MTSKYWNYQEKVVPEELAKRCAIELKQFVLEHHIRDESSLKAKRSRSQPLFVFVSGAGKRYQYFGTWVDVISFPDCLSELQKVAETLLEEKEKGLDCAFVNLYRSGKDSVLPHRDVTHGSEAPILSFSFYEDLDVTETKDLRTLVIQNDQDQFNLLMKHRSVVIMKSGMQQLYLHGVSETNSEKCRVNVTFRKHNTL